LNGFESCSVGIASGGRKITAFAEFIPGIKQDETFSGSLIGVGIEPFDGIGEQAGKLLGGTIREVPAFFLVEAVGTFPGAILTTSATLLNALPCGQENSIPIQFLAGFTGRLFCKQVCSCQTPLSLLCLSNRVRA